MAVYQLEATQSTEARALFEAASVDFDRPFWEAAFDGRMPSRLYVDDPGHPRSALLTRTYDPELIEIERRAFRLPDEGYRLPRDWGARLPEGVRVVPLDAELARRADTEIPEVIGIIWDGCERFAAAGWGFAALDADRRVLSTAYACGLTDRAVNIGVGTAQSAQRRGLGKLVCQACIAHAERNGLDVTWDCDQENIASGKLAESLGFIEEDGFIEFGFSERSMPEGIAGRWGAEQVGDGVVR